MALFFMAASLNPKPCSNIYPPVLHPKHQHPFKLISSSSSSSRKTFAQLEGKEGGVEEEDPPASFAGIRYLFHFINVVYFVLIAKNFSVYSFCGV